MMAGNQGETPRRQDAKEIRFIASGGEAVIGFPSVSSVADSKPKNHAKVNHGRGADKAKRLAMSRYRNKLCAQCGAPFKPVKSDSRFCCHDHRKAYHALRQLYGARIMDLALLWRRKRQPGGFAAFTAQLDAILRDHKDELGFAVTGVRKSKEQK